MKIILDDTIYKKSLYPFTATRSVADIRVGILTIREKWERLLGKKINTISEIDSEDSEAKGVQKISANIIPSQQWLDSFLSKQNIAAKTLEYPWHIFQNNDQALREDFDLICRDRMSSPISSTNKTISPGNIFIEEGAVIEHSILNASDGPIYIGKNAMVMEGCLIRGPVAIC